MDKDSRSLFLLLHSQIALQSRRETRHPSFQCCFHILCMCPDLIQYLFWLSFLNFSLSAFYYLHKDIQPTVSKCFHTHQVLLTILKIERTLTSYILNQAWLYISCHRALRRPQINKMEIYISCCSAISKPLQCSCLIESLLSSFLIAIIIYQLSVPGHMVCTWPGVTHSSSGLTVVLGDVKVYGQDFFISLP